MADRHLKKSTPNKKWMNGFRVQKARTDLPHRNDGDHAYGAGTQNIKSRGKVE